MLNMSVIMSFFAHVAPRLHYIAEIVVTKAQLNLPASNILCIIELTFS